MPAVALAPSAGRCKAGMTTVSGPECVGSPSTLSTCPFGQPESCVPGAWGRWMHPASPVLWKKSGVLIPWLFLGRWCVVQRKHWIPEIAVAAGGSGRHDGAGARSAELCGLCRGRGPGSAGPRGRGQRPEAVRSHRKRPEGPPLVHSFTLFDMRYTL